MHFGIFIAFAAIYPNVELLFRIQAKWVALAFGVLSALQLLSANAWPQLLAFLITVAYALVFIRARGIGPELEWWTNLTARFRPKPKFHGRPALGSAPRDRARECLRFDRPVARKNLAIRHQQPDRE